MTGLLAVAAIGATALIAARHLGAAAPPGGTALPAATDLCRGVDDAYLSGTLHGAVDRGIEWRGTDMRCEGGMRPGGDGVRLVFSFSGQGDDRLVIVIGIAGAIGELTLAERAANVTVIDAASGRFFSSRGRDRCWTTVASVTGAGPMVSVAGEVYCSGSLPSVTDGSSISLRDFRFAGRLMTDAS